MVLRQVPDNGITGAATPLQTSKSSSLPQFESKICRFSTAARAISTECIAHRADLGTLPDAQPPTRLPSQVPALPPTRSARCLVEPVPDRDPGLPSLLSAQSPAHSPRRLRSAGCTGVDSPISRTARIACLTAWSGLGSHTPRIADAGVPWGPMTCPIGDFRGQTGSRECWSERVSHRYTRIVIALTPQDPACPPPIHGRHTPEHGINTDRYTRAMRGHRVFRADLPSPGIDPASICVRQLPRVDRFPVGALLRCRRIALLQRSPAHRQNRSELVAYSPLPGQQGAMPTVLEQVEVTSARRAE